MYYIDWSLLANWTVPAFIGLVFGIIGGYVTHRFQRSRDDANWEREKFKLEQQWHQEKERMKIQWEQKLQELQIQFLRDDNNRLRSELAKGIDDPKTISRIMEVRHRMENQFEFSMAQFMACVSFLQSASSTVPVKEFDQFLEKIKILQEALEKAKTINPPKLQDGSPPPTSEKQKLD